MKLFLIEFPLKLKKITDMANFLFVYERINHNVLCSKVLPYPLSIYQRHLSFSSKVWTAISNLF